MRTKLAMLFIGIGLALILAACGANGDLTLTGQFNRSDEGVLTMKDGATLQTQDGMTLTGENGEIRINPGQTVKAIGDVVIDMELGTYTGTLEFSMVEAPSNTPSAVTATPELPTSTPDQVTETPMGATTSQSSASWICFTEGAETSLTYTQLMASNPMRVEHKVTDISLCPFDESATKVYYHWTQFNPHVDVLGDTQGWFRQGDQTNVVNECMGQPKQGWCLVTND